MSPLATIFTLRLVSNRLTSVVSAILVDTDAAAWYAQGLPVVLAESRDEARSLADEVAKRVAEMMAAEWKSRGIGTPVMWAGDVVEQMELFEEAA